MTNNMPPMPIKDARRLVEEAAARLERIRARSAELSIRANATLSHATQADRHLALALVDGDAAEVARLQEEATRTAGPAAAMTPAEARRALAALRTLEAECQVELSDARLALRRSVVAALDAELAARSAAYDEAAQRLQEAWTQVTVLFELMAGMTAVQKAPPGWHQLQIPRTSDDGTRMQRLAYLATGELMTGHQYHAASAAVLAGLAERGVVRADVGR